MAADFLPEVMVHVAAQFSDLGYAARRKQTRRDRFLGEIDAITPWAALVEAIEPHYPKGKLMASLPRLMPTVIFSRGTVLTRDAIVEQLVATGDWGERDARISARANFKCEYCDLDLLGSVRAYKEWNKDHIVPRSAGGSDSEDNIALACRICNFSLKNRWNPEPRCKPGASREELIAAVRNYIRGKTTAILKQVQGFREIAFRDSTESKQGSSTFRPFGPPPDAAKATRLKHSVICR